MYIIAGLGNPGTKYAGSRHNMGFDVVDILSKKLGISLNAEKYHAMVGSGFYEGQKVVLVKPLTFMNLSGTAIAPLVNFYKIDPEEELIVISDDIDLKPGRIRIRKKGSAGGHNGLKNIIELIGTETFPRIRVGVGAKEKNRDLASHVLSRPQGEDENRILEAQEAAALAVMTAITSGIDQAMNDFNKFRTKEEQAEEELKRLQKAEARRKAQEEKERLKAAQANAPAQDAMIRSEEDADIH